VPVKDIHQPVIGVAGPTGSELPTQPLADYPTLNLCSPPAAIDSLRRQFNVIANMALRYAWAPERHHAIPIARRFNMLSKTSLASGVLIATAAGVVMTSVPSFAQVLTWGGGCASSCSSFGHGNRNRSFNANENDGFNHVRLRLRNRNNNIATARNDEEDQRPVIVERQQEKGK
jgi:hypothetical protein